MIANVFSSRTSLFWILLTSLAGLGAGITYHYFNESYPLISVSITMDRQQALKCADQLSSEHGWLPTEHRAAVEFKNEPLLQYFIELECGGKKVFTDLLHSKEYEPYQWHVRHFQEKVTHETSVFFAPDGTPYGFELKLPETECKPNLTTENARELAQRLATDEWNVSFSQYKEIETSKEQTPCGRLDHTFVYERTDVQLGKEGKYRLKLVVSGDALTTLERFVFIPETFTRRFEEMRSSNTTVSTIGSLCFQILYRFLGCLVAGFLFLRRRSLRIVPSVYWGAFFGVLKTALIINTLPLLWMSYDTATSASSFLTHVLFQAVGEGLKISVILTAFIAICLTWDTLAFPGQIAFAKLWSHTVGRSRAVLGRTLGGYLFVPLWLGFCLSLIYLLLTEVFDWWSPADTLVNPNILATYVPWVTPFAMAAEAGFTEEILFRALPLAACTLAGRALGRERLGMVIGLIGQALIFGACHALYPQMPGYFRLVELFIPSIALGCLYLFYGLLPAMLAHFVYDFFFMSLPIFSTTHATHALVDKIIVILLLFSPLLIVLYRRMRANGFYDIRQEDRNGAFVTASLLPSKQPALKQHTAVPISHLPSANKKILACAGIMGAGLWLWMVPFKADTPTLEITKKEAIARAEQDFEEREITTPLGFVWHRYAYLATNLSVMDAFVWQEEGPQKYHELLGSYLTAPRWAVRCMSFSGQVTDRAQEFTSLIGPEGKVIRSNLSLPESAPGATISEGQARGIALQAIERELNLSPDILKELSAIVHDRPQRKDWVFTFQDKTVPFSTGGQARITVTICGDTVSNVYQHVFVPEEWLRKKQQTDTYRQLAELLVSFVVLAACIAAGAMVQKRLFAAITLSRAAVAFLILIPMGILALLNSADQFFVPLLHSSQPYETQLFSFFGGMVAKVLIFICLLTLGIIGSRSLITSRTHGCSSALYAAGAEFFRHGISWTIILLSKDLSLPLVAQYLPLNSFWVWGAVFDDGITTFLQVAVIELIIVAGFIQISKNSSRPLLWGVGLFVVSCAATCSSSGVTLFVHPSSVVLFCVLKGAILTATYYLLVRYDQRTIIMMAATGTALVAIEHGLLQPYPNALFYGLISGALVISAGYYWFTILGKE